MKVIVDISVLTPVVSVGHVSGEIDVMVVPRKGEALSFLINTKGIPPVTVLGYSGIVRIVSVTHAVGNGLVMLELEDLVVPSFSEGCAVMNFLENAFGLAAVFHEVPTA